jgi:hypothetical protein
MNCCFHALLGGIDAVIHWIQNYTVDKDGRVIPVAPPNDSASVNLALQDLTAIKQDLLRAEGEFMMNMANREHIPALYTASVPAGFPPSAPVQSGQKSLTNETNPPSPFTRADVLKAARLEWELSYESHCADWIAVLTVQAERFAGAIYSLQLQAPEWSLLDLRLAELMERFKRSAEAKGGAGDTVCSWGSNFPGNSSSSCSGS